jgi:6-pyruvoyltetrahydropterin/6-carboxytetrahydropterin synthase
MSGQIENPDLLEVASIFKRHQDRFSFFIISDLMGSDNIGLCYGKEKKDRFREDPTILSLNLNLQGISTHRIAKFCGISQAAVHKRIKKGLALLKEKFPHLEQTIKERQGETKMILRVKSHFDAAHKLAAIKGPCSRLHGHRWRVEVEFEGSIDKRSGMVDDFTILKKVVRNNLPDHSFLNDRPGIGNPTAENIAIWIYGLIASDIKMLATRARLSAVTVWESDDCGVTYKGGE